MLLTNFKIFRKIFFDEMKEYSAINQIKKYSSPRVHKLINIIQEHLKSMKGKDNYDSAPDTALCGLVFVERRITAKVIYHILKVT